MGPKFLILLNFPLFWILLGCGQTTQRLVEYEDSNTASVAPQFLVSIESNLSSSFKQNQPAARDDSTGQLFYYFSTSPDRLKSCVVALNLVDFDSTYHSGTPALSDCSSFAAQLLTDRLFPLAPEDLTVGRGLTIPKTGYIYALFFYNPTNSTSGVGTTSPSDVISSSNRCVRVWGAKIVDGQLYAKGDQLVSSPINLSNLRCFGF